MPNDAPLGDGAATKAAGDAAALAALRAELARLQADNARLSGDARRARLSAEVQALRAVGAVGESHLLRLQIKAVQASLFWRITAPLRVAVDLARGAPQTGSPDAVRIRRLLGVLRREGPAAAAKLVQRHLQTRRRKRAEAARAAALAATPPPPPGIAPPGARLAPSVLIVAELTLPQCAKYRVWQKQEHFTRLGIPCRVVDWRLADECLSAASLCTQAILYRVPAFPPVEKLIAHLHALRVPVAWEVDDLIFDRGLYLQNRNIDEIEPAVREGILSGVELYRAAMLACGAGIASTPHLAEAMRAAGLKDVHVIENALDDETLALAARLRAERRPHEGIVIVYGSGTKTHNADFREAAPALLRVLRDHPGVRLRIIGELELPPEFDAFGARVERHPPAHYARYLEFLANSDVSIAPLEPTLFNDAKSNIKFLEAAILSVPSVCSPRANFAAIVRDGENGMLAEGDGWFTALETLVTDAGLRTRLGAAAQRDVVARYAPEQVARLQVAPLGARAPDTRPAKTLRVLFANVYFAPRSFGGATLVVEEMARRLQARGDTDVHVVTVFEAESNMAYATRNEWHGAQVITLPGADPGLVGEFDNPAMGLALGRVLDAVQPDVVHLHSVQWLSASLATVCRDRGIPYVITLHDAWWLCARQFMVREDGQYCFQEQIDLRVCHNCCSVSFHLEHRQALLKAALDGASLLLAPSQSHRRLYLANGVDPARLQVAPNGVRHPAAPPRRTPSNQLRFAYVGGAVDIKGYSIVKRAFEALSAGGWELLLVDNTLALGFSSVDIAGWQVCGALHVVPPYTQDSMDDFFAGVDVLLFPSQWKESFGLTVREALLRDVWVIATDGGGPAEAIREGVNGNLIPLDGRHENLQHAVQTLLADPAKLAGYRNPHREDIPDFAWQADALHASLQNIMRKRAA